MTTSHSKHSHYYKDVKHLETVDVYRVLELFSVVNPCLQHAVKKLLVAGGRGAGKDQSRDIQEAIDSLVRWQQMRDEDAPAQLPPIEELTLPHCRVRNLSNSPHLMRVWNVFDFIGFEYDTRCQQR